MREVHASDVQLLGGFTGPIIGAVQPLPIPIQHLIQVGRRIDGTWVRLTVSPDGFLNFGPAVNAIVFDGPDCTGQPYFDTGSAGSPLLLSRFLEEGMGERLDAVLPSAWLGEL